MKDDYPFPDKCEKCIHENVCYMVGECVNHIPGFECDCFEEKRPNATFDLYKDDMYSGGFYLICSSCKWRFATGAYKILVDDNYCPHCGAKIKRAKDPKEITLTFNVEKIEKFKDASCENCEHAFRGADPLKIVQDSKYLFYCAAGHAYGGSETVCSEWRRKEGDRNEID